MKTRRSLMNSAACALMAILLCSATLCCDGSASAANRSNDLSPKITGASPKASSAPTAIPSAVAVRPYKKLTGNLVFRGGPAAVTNGFGSILSGLGYLGNSSQSIWTAFPAPAAGLPVSDALGSILAGLGYRSDGAVEREWRDAYPVNGSVGVMLTGLGYRPGTPSGQARASVAAPPPITRSMASMLKGLGYGAGGTSSAHRRLARARR